MFEHASYDQPRLEHGLCTDDNARALIVLCRTGSLSPPVAAAFERYLRFVESGRIETRRPDGTAVSGWHNRMDAAGAWTDVAGPDDCHGRALWGLGVTAASAPVPEWRERARVAFSAGADLESPHLRSWVFAGLGAEAAWRADSTIAAAEGLLERAASRLPRPRPGAWRWPDDRLTYANARIPEVMMAVGVAVGDHRMVDDAVDLLDWLVGVETFENHFSFTPVGGRGPGDHAPGFDQQPIEAWAMADACALAASTTGDPVWESRRSRAVAWFLGDNDTGVALYDAATGGGYDGLDSGGVNRNQGAESTLAALGALLTAPDRG